MKVGIGFDAHRLVFNRKLVLGGVEIPFEKGLLGHSDADVLVHAICDALLGSIGKGDMGCYFPDTDPSLKDISSLNLLLEVGKMVREEGMEIVNIDSTIVAEKPKLMQYIPEMIKNLAEVLHIDKGQISIKAKTTEGLGFTGRAEGIAAYAVVLIKRRD